MNRNKFPRYRLPQVRVKLVHEGRSMFSDHPFENPAQIARAFSSLIRYSDREVVAVVLLDTALHPVAFNIISVGSVNESMVPAYQVLRPAILSGASGIVMLHNHPSGNLQPSDHDLECTRSMIEACRICGIQLLDHLICSGNDYVSLAQTTRIFDE